MKIPLRYQVSEYDCGPTSLLNALNYLFQREEISPELIRNIAFNHTLEQRNQASRFFHRLPFD